MAHTQDFTGVLILNRIVSDGHGAEYLLSSATALQFIESLEAKPMRVRVFNKQTYGIKVLSEEYSHTISYAQLTGNKEHVFLSLKGTITLPDDMDIGDYTIRVSDNTTHDHTPLRVEDILKFSLVKIDK